MTIVALEDFLHERSAAGGFTTEDALVSFLPLLRQVVETHAAGMVAPLDGLAALKVESARIWFENAARRQPRANDGEIRRLDAPLNAALEVVAERRSETDIGAGQDVTANLRIGRRDQPLTRPVYLPGYVCWEHLVEHHDALADTFCLGLVLAGMMTRLDLCDPAQLGTFVEHRSNLFRLNPGLHPVLAKAIVRLTELSRHRRPQDLRAVLRSLEHYRDQTVDLDFDPASLAEVPAGQTRRQALLARLQERLFEISPRNRLLQFRPTLSTVNLTQASVPLSFDVSHIRPDQLLTWRGAFKDAVVAGEEVLLNRYLSFDEMPFLPGQLDRIRVEAQRDQAEFGFEQLRLVLCFLRWADLKQKPAELYASPLVLVPVRMAKRKGVRDAFWIKPLEDEAEVNPVVRYLFRRLYGIVLPESIRLTESALDDLFALISTRVQASDPGIALTKVDRPRIELIHDLARRRLDSFQRQTQLSGRGVQTLYDLDYSYDTGNYHPLGIRLYSARIRRTDVHLRQILAEAPAPRHFLVDESGGISQREKRFYSLRQGGDENPYAWEYDLCCVTLGNFRYRRMSLVRDYDELIAEERENPAFDTLFALSPRPVGVEVAQGPPLDERYHVVSCDPTQAAAIGLARRGLSYIIQGPPGTGKSQTITNLIADYAVQGRRVLFVCEKRAAIDVVFQRLKQRGLGQLGCLIHDSQTDKKEVIADLKATYEAFLAEREAPPEHRRRRRQLLHLLRQELEPLQGFHEAMRGATPETGLPPRDLLDRVLALREHLPALSALERERLPGYGVWYDHRERIDRFRLVLRDLQPDGVFCRHPLHPLGGQIGRAERPLEFLLGRLTEARDGLARLAECLDRAGVPAEWRRTLPEVEVLTGFAAQVAELAEWGVFAALDPACDLARRLHAEAARQRQLEAALVDARQACRHWRRRLPRQDVAAALAQAEAFERSLFCFLRPAWWRLRRALNECYDFRAHTVVPLGSQVLRALEDEYAAAAALARGEAAFREQFGVPLAAAELSARLTAVGAALAARPASVQALGRRLLAGDPRPTVRALLEAAQVLAALRAALATFLDSPETLELEHLPAALDRIEAASGQLPEFLLCLGELVQLPVPLGDCLRTLPLSTVQLEAAIADHSLDWRCRTDRRLNRFTAEVRRRHLGFLDAYSRAWEEINAAAVREAVRQRFLGHVRLSAAPAAGLSPREREIKKRYESGRRELEHEFGKVMRFRSIRDLASSDSGLVLRDLKPVWLMSPLSVSDAVPLDGSPFDVVIFDEASQITLEEAVPALFRARQAIVVGDEMQLPPTSFFSAKRDDGEGEAWYGDDEEQSEYDLSGNSFLNHAARSLPAQMLGWHYRSRSESLIGFSNWAFYQGRLLTVPDEELSHLARPEISAVAASDGQANAEPLLERPVSFHLLAQGTYQNRRNRSEAEYIAHLVRALVRHPRRLSLGIVAFSEAQQDEIESALERLAREDPEFRGQLEAEFEREEDGQFVGLLVKNLENIQGDERDVVILSVCYGHGPDGRMLMNFGPINQSGGERRLNVAFSRAKRHMAVVSSIRYSDIRNEYNDGANCLRSYLQYAACMSAGDCAGAGRVLRALAAGRDAAAEAARAAARDCVVSRQLAGALSRQGYEVDLGVGMSSFRCDLAIRRQGDAAYRLGVLLDTPDYYAQTDLLERDLMRPRLLEAFGWRVSSVLAKDWYQDADGVLARLLESLERGPEARTTPPAPAEMAPLDVEALIASVDVPDEPEPPVDLELGDGAPGAEQDEVLGDASEAVPPGLAEGRQLRFEFSEGTSSKFWEVWYDGPYLSVRFGRIGSDGQTRVKAFATRNEAAAEAARLVRQKLGKGYRPVPASG